MSTFAAEVSKIASKTENEWWNGSILNEIQEVVWSIDPRSERVVYLNRAAERIYGRELRQFYENYNLWLEAIHPNERDRARQLLETVLSTGSAEVEYRIIRPNWQVAWVRHKAWQILDDSGKAIRIDGIISEIAQRKQWEDISDRDADKKEYPVRVLLIDDRPIVGESVRRMLANEKDIVFHYCSDPNRAIQLATEIEPTVILQDLVMPDMDGLKLLRLFRERQATRDIPTIALSVTEEASLKAEAFAAGANDFIVKLPEPIELIARIRYHSQAYINLKHRQSEESRYAAKLEKQLASQEALFSSFFSAASVGLLILDEQLRYVLINETLAEMNGLSVAEHIGKSIREVLPEMTCSIIEPIFRKILESGEAIVNYEINAESPKFPGEMHSWMISWFPLTDATGRRVGIGGVISEITDRKRSEAALVKSEARNRAFVEALPDLLFWMSKDGTYLDFNAPAGSEFLRKNVVEVLPGDIAQLILHHIKVALSTRGLQIFEYQLTSSSGELCDFEGRMAPIGEEEVLLIVRDISDRKKAEKALRESEQFLRTIYEGVEQVIFTVDVSEDGDFRYAGSNPAAQRVSGISDSEANGKTPEEVQGEVMGAKLRRDYAKCLQAGTAITYEECYTFQNEDTWWLTILNPLRDLQGRIYKIVGTAYNITQRKQAELALQQSEAQLKELVAREALLNRLATQIRNSLDLDTILETTVQEIYKELEIDTCIFSWYRPHTSPPTWQPIKEAKSQNSPSWLGSYPVDIFRPFSEKILRLEIFRVDDIAEVSDEATQQMLLNSGTVSLLSLPIQTHSGEIGALICGRLGEARAWDEEDLELLQAVANQLAIAINQAELYTTSQNTARLAQAQAIELQQTLLELQRTQTQLIQTEKMSSLGQLVAGVAHEINNPVNFIFGNLIHAEEYTSALLQLIQLYRTTYLQPTSEIQEEIETIDLDFLIEDLPKMLESMKVGAERIREIVKSLRTFSRLDEAEMKPVDLHENIDSTLTILQSRLKGRSDRGAISLIKEYGNLPLVECCAGQLNQVFMNLIANAIDALEEKDKNSSLAVNSMEIKSGDVRAALRNSQSSIPTIRIKTAVLSNNWVQIRIADSGIGMPKAVMKKIFDPFYTTKPIGKGTGLGLSISYQIVVEKHKGNLRCISEEGKGTEFIIEIPRSPI